MMPGPPSRTNHTPDLGPLPGLWEAALQGLRLNPLGKGPRDRASSSDPPPSGPWEPGTCGCCAAEVSQRTGESRHLADKDCHSTLPEQRRFKDDMRSCCEECFLATWGRSADGPPAWRCLDRLRWATLGPQFLWTPVGLGRQVAPACHQRAARRPPPLIFTCHSPRCLLLSLCSPPILFRLGFRLIIQGLSRPPPLARSGCATTLTRRSPGCFLPPFFSCPVPSLTPSATAKLPPIPSLFPYTFQAAQLGKSFLHWGLCDSDAPSPPSRPSSAVHHCLPHLR